MIAPINPALLQVRGLCKYFPVFKSGFMKRKVGEIRAVDDVSFDLIRGETLGLVGESGSGKTTVARTILRAIDPTRGDILFTDDAATINLARLSAAAMKPLRTKMQMVFQDPFSSLNPRLTVRDIVAEPLVIHRLARGSALEDRVSETLRLVGLKPEHRHRYPHAFSGGQRQRIGIARALIMRPTLVVADEAVSALDVSVQAQVINLLRRLQVDLGLTILFIAHDLSVVRHLCTRVAVMYAGRLVETANTVSLFEDPKHPYTRALLSSVPSPNPDRPIDFSLSGEVADPGNLPAGCSFHPRCTKCFELCTRLVPQLRKLCDGRYAACHLYGPAEGGPQ